MGTATTGRRAWNYDDETVNVRWMVYYDTPSSMEHLAITYNMGEGTVICTGIRYRYNNVGSNPTNMEIRFEGESFWVGYQDLNIDYVTGDTWRTFRCLGPTYLLDDDPVVYCIGIDTSSNCPSICATEPSAGHSYYNVGSGWYLDTSYEYLVDLLYEWIINLNIETTIAGSITASDYVDAYYVTLTGGIKYEFELERTSGSGDLNMRLVVNQDLTNNILVQSSGTSDPEYMTYTPSSTGTYVLLVEPNTPNTDIADYSINYYVEQTPNADFISNVTSIFEGESVEFTFTGAEGNTPATYLWDFGDTTPTSSDQNPIHQYTSAGNYTVSLTVTDNDNDMDNEIKTNYIMVESDFIPIADFTSNITKIFEGESVQFTYNGTEGNTPTTYLWNFGDSTPTSTDQNPIHQYTSIGTYTVNLTVTDNDGDIDNEVKPNYITVETDISPIADFSADKVNISQGEIIQFTFTGSEGNAPATYLWDFGDGTPTSSDENPSHQYLDAGEYNVSLLVTDRNDDFDFIEKINYITVNLNELPIANFTVNQTEIIEGQWVQFNFTGIEGTIPASFQWNFGDSSPISSERNPIHQYNSSGLFWITLNVTDNNGDFDVYLDFIVVNIDLLPDANFNVNTSLLIEEGWVNFTFIGDMGNLPTTFLWDFGDGSPTSDEQNPLHYYNTVDNFTVTLTLMDTDGDIDIETKVNLISVITDISPIANFIADQTTIDAGESVQFTFIGSEGNTPATFEWDFGDGSPISTEKNPSHIYNTPGTYSVSLIIIDFNGDTNNITIINYIHVEDIQLSIIITNPVMNDVYGRYAPAYCISIIGDNIDLIWYTLNEGTSLHFITTLTDLIDQEAWDALPEGHVIIRFYAQDTEERSCYKDVIIIKDLSSEDLPRQSTPGIPGFDLKLIIGTISLITIIFILKILKYKNLFLKKN